jgi:hypothetical protein
MKSMDEMRRKEDQIYDAADPDRNPTPEFNGQRDALGWLMGESEEITEGFEGIPLTDADLDKVIELLLKEKENIPEFSHFGDPNWRVIDAQISIMKWAKD